MALLSSILIIAAAILAECQSSACLRSGAIRLEPPSSSVTGRLKRPSDPVRPLVRILNPGPLLEYFSHSPLLASIGTAVSTTFRVTILAVAPRSWRRGPSQSIRLSRGQAMGARAAP